MKMMVSKFGISSSSSMLIFGGVLLNNSLLIILKKAGYFGGWHWGPEDNMEPENTALEKETHLNQTIIFSLKNCSSSFIFRFCVIPLASHWFSPNGSPTKNPCEQRATFHLSSPFARLKRRWPRFGRSKLGGKGRKNPQQNRQQVSELDSLRPQTQNRYKKSQTTFWKVPQWGFFFGEKPSWAVTHRDFKKIPTQKSIPSTKI